jgi:methionine sulfoxide reductase catalytic subunit
MSFRWSTDLNQNDITDERLFKQRRTLIKGAAAIGTGSILGMLPSIVSATTSKIDNFKNGMITLNDDQTPLKDAASYTNFYELGSGKREPKKNAAQLKTEPWSVLVDGEVGKPGRVPLETILAPHALEERVYRLRCVEAWSMVIPWIGFPLADLLKRFEPTANAKYVAFETIYDPKNLEGQKRDIIQWPYREGLRMDEAMHPLSIIAVGMYGRTLPNQNGAPLRLVIPWKYGFKSIKSIVRISLTAEKPVTSWNQKANDEYGFYANVNPKVDHPRWDQSRERRIGDFLRRDTLMFNGYAEHVAQLYSGMDLVKNF